MQILKDMKKSVAIASMVLFGWWYSLQLQAQCSPDRIPPIFETLPMCDSAYCQGPLPSGVPPVSDNCSNPVVSEAPEIVGGTFNCNGNAFLVYGPQDMPDVPYVLSQHNGMLNGEDTLAVTNLNGINGIGYYCEDTTGCHIYGLWTEPGRRTDFFVVDSPPVVYFAEVEPRTGQIFVMDTIPPPPKPMLPPGDTVGISLVSVHVGDVANDTFYFVAVSTIIDTVRDTVLDLRLFLGRIYVGSPCQLAAGFTPLYKPIQLDVSCLPYLLLFQMRVDSFMRGLISFPSGGFQDWAATPDGDSLYAFMGVENALIGIDLATAIGSCIPGDVANVSNGYVGSTGLMTDEFSGMFFIGNQLMGFQSDRGRIFSISRTNPSTLTLLDILPKTDLRGDAASCRDCTDSLRLQACPYHPVRRRIIRAIDAAGNINYAIQYVFPRVQDTVAPVLHCMDTTVMLHMGCDTVVKVRKPLATDNCNSDSLTVTVVSPTPLMETDTTVTFMVEAGNNIITWQVEDCSGNTSTCQSNILVQLVPAPDVACKDINVSLDEDCMVVLEPYMVYAGDTTNGFCNSAFSIELRDETGALVPNNKMGRTHVGKTLYYTLILEQNGNKCWGKVLVEDKMPPRIDSCFDDTLFCYQPFDVSPPVVSDNCSTARPVLVDEQIMPVACNATDSIIKKVVQKWVAVDSSGNVSLDTCMRTIYIKKINPNQIVFPRDTVLYCAEVPGALPGPDVLGVPHLGTLPLYPFPPVYCNMNTNYEDMQVVFLPCRKEWIRIWKVFEFFCDTHRIIQHVQRITIVDTLGPSLEVFPRTLTATTGRYSCEANVWLPAATVADACNGVAGIRIHYPGGVLSTNGGLARLPVGVHHIVYEVFDSCYNVTRDTITATVRDQTPPVAVCKSRIVVSLNGMGMATLKAQDVDLGSFDECGVDYMEVQRMGADSCGGANPPVWGPEVVFCCADVGTEVMVNFRVVDLSGNSGTCMVTVEVQDKVPPLVQCPPDITVDCQYSWDPTNLGVFGELVAHDSLRDTIVIDVDSVFFGGPPIDGLAYDNCPLTIVEEVDTSAIDQCGEGTLIRTFIVTDAQGNSSSCTQTIVFRDFHELTADSIVWPKDYTLVDSCNTALLDPDVLPDSSALPKVPDNACRLVGMSFSDDTLYNVLAIDACVKILRTWTVIDWCQTAGGSYAQWTHTQVIKLINTVAPVITSPCTDTMKCTYNANCAPDTFVLSATATDDCTPSDALFWQYFIDLNNDGTIDITGTGNTATVVVPADTHRIRWIVEDKCGNTSDCSYTFELRNCKAPTAYCMSGVVYELDSADSDGNGIPDTVWVKARPTDIDMGSSHPCGYPVVLSFSADTTDTLRIFNCDSVGLRTVEMWVTDIVNGNTSKCVVTVDVQDNKGLCPSPLKGTIAGSIRTSSGELVPGVDVYLDRSNGLMVQTDNEGRFRFDNIPLGASYRVRPHSTKGYLYGISTKDLIAIHKHLLGIRPLDNPYAIIAADVNRSEDISVADMGELRKLILGKIRKFRKNTSWRFVPKNYDFIDPKDPFLRPFPEVYDLDPFEGDVDLAFVGIKIGDVNGDYRFRGVSPRYVSQREILIEDETLKPGQTARIRVQARRIHELEGMQATMEFNTEELEIVRVIPNTEIGMTLEHFNLEELREGIFAFVWVANNRVFDNTLFELVVRAKRSTSIERAFGLSNRIIAPEAYLADGDEQLVLRFIHKNGRSHTPSHAVVYAPRPNPWSESTVIGFYLPQAQQIQLVIRSHTGQIVFHKRGFFHEGYGEMRIAHDELPHTGTYIYELIGAEFHHTGKMVLIE